MQDDRVEGLLGKGRVSGGCFDVTVERVFARTSSARARTRPDEPEIYRCLGRRTRFDAIGVGDRASEYPMALRVIRRRLPVTGGGKGAKKGRWLDLVTNLPAGEFEAKWLVRTHGRRWGHETCYRHLKKVVGMEDPKTRVFERAAMEVWGRIALHNACSLATRKALARRLRGRRRRRARDLATAYKAVMEMVRGAEVDIEAVCARHTHVVAGGRRFGRRPRNKSPAKLGYRH